MASLPYPRHPLNNPPTDGTDAHRCLGCVVLSHGTRRIHRSSPLQENSVNSVGVHFSKRLLCVLWEDAMAARLVRVAALNNPPTDSTDAHRCLGCVVLSHGTRRIHRSSPLQENSVNSVGVHFSKRLLCVLWEDAMAARLVRVAALNNPPTDSTDAHRCLGCVVLSHGTRRIHRSSPLQENSVNSVGVHFSKRLLCVL